jgi:hypothetical protein
MRNRESRTSLRLPVSIARQAAALTADISDQGVCLELFQPMRIGAEVDGFVLHGERELTFKGEVAWAKPGNPMASLFGTMGVKFTWVSPGLRALLSIEQRRQRFR